MSAWFGLGAVLLPPMLGLGPAWAGDGVPYTVQDAVGMASARSPELRAARARADAASARKDAAWAALWPSLSGVGSMQRQRKDREAYLTDSATGKAVLSLSQSILDLQSFGSARQADAAAAAAEMDFAAAQQALTASVAEAYVGVMEARELERLADANRDLSVKHLDSTRQRFEAGELTRTDVARAEARAEAARADWLSARGAVVRAALRFTEVIGAEPPQVLAPVSVAEGPAVTAETSAPLVQARPDVRAMELRVDAARRGGSVEKRARIPTLSLFGEAGRDWAGTRRWPEPTLYRTLGVSMSVPIWSSGRISARVRGAEAAVQEASENLERQRRAGMREAAEQILGLDDLLQTVEAQERAANAAQNALDFVSEEFSAGTRSALDYLGAQEDLFRSRTGLARATHAVTRAKIKLRLALGVLTADSLK